LLEPNGIDWQRMQGYELLAQAAALRQPRVFYTLSGQDETIKQYIQNHIWYRHENYSKSEIKNPEQIKILSTHLHQMCQETVTLIASIPEAAEWKKSTRKPKNENEIKKLEKQSKEIENYLSLYDQYLNQYYDKECRIHQERINLLAMDIWTYVFGFIQTKNFDGILDIREKYSLKLSNNPQLFSVMVLRRIWLATFYSYFDDSFNETIEKVYRILFFEYKYFTKKDAGNRDEKPHQILSKLCLTQNSIYNHRFLPEEKLWLKIIGFKLL
jgi:hypothetical protein